MILSIITSPKCQCAAELYHFLWLLLFSICESLHVAVKTINVFLHLYFLFYYCRSLQYMQYALWYTQVRFDRDLDLSRSSVTWPFACQCPWSISYRCSIGTDTISPREDIKAQMYLGHGFDLTGSHIGHRPLACPYTCFPDTFTTTSTSIAIILSLFEVW